MTLTKPFCARSPLSLLLILAICCSTACSEALPRDRPEKEIGDALIRAERAAAEASRQAAEAKAQVAESERLVKEARDLALQAEQSRGACSANYQRMLDAERAREAARRRAAAAAAAAKAREAKEAETPTEPAVPAATESPQPQKTKDPEYSPSDAPL